MILSLVCGVFSIGYAIGYAIEMHVRLRQERRHAEAWRSLYEETRDHHERMFQTMTDHAQRLAEAFCADHVARNNRSVAAGAERDALRAELDEEKKEAEKERLYRIQAQRHADSLWELAARLVNKLEEVCSYDSDMPGEDPVASADALIDEARAALLPGDLSEDE